MYLWRIPCTMEISYRYMYITLFIVALESMRGTIIHIIASTLVMSWCLLWWIGGSVRRRLAHLRLISTGGTVMHHTCCQSISHACVRRYHDQYALFCRILCLMIYRLSNTHCSYTAPTPPRAFLHQLSVAQRIPCAWGQEARLSVSVESSQWNILYW